MSNSEIADRVLCWTARILGACSLGMLSLFVFAHLGEGRGAPTVSESLGLMLFPGCILIGLAVSFFRPLHGSALTLGGLVGFYAWHLVEAGNFPSGPYFLLFAAPGILFLLSGLLSQKRLTTSQRTDAP